MARISADPHIARSMEECLGLIRELENNEKIPEDKFAGETASALAEAQRTQVRLLKEAYGLLSCL